MHLEARATEGGFALTFEVGSFGAVDEAVFESGHEPNGYFWEGFVQFAWPEIAAGVDFDGEGGAFVACADKPDLLDLLVVALNPILQDPEGVTAVVARADAKGFDFDD